MEKYLIDCFEFEKATLRHSIIVECEDIESLESLPDPEDDSDISYYARRFLRGDIVKIFIEIWSAEIK